MPDIKIAVPQSNLKDLPPVPTTADPQVRTFLERLKEHVQGLRSFRGDPLDGAITWRSALANGIVSINPANPGDPGGTGGQVGPPPVGGPPDLTPPPTPTGLTAAAAVTHVMVQFDVPTYTMGHGNLQTNIYAVHRDPDSTDPLPTFSSAVLVGSAPGDSPLFAIDSDPNVKWFIWAKYKTVDGVESVSPAGGTNGVQATTAKIDGSLQIGHLTVDDAIIFSCSINKLIAGTLNVGQYIQSADYIAGTRGWRIESQAAGASYMEIDKAIIRGTVYASLGSIGGADIGATYVQSSGYAGFGTAGWRLDNGTGQFLAESVRIKNSAGDRIFDTEATGTQSVLKIGTAINIDAAGNATFGGTLTALHVVDTSQLAAGAATFIDDDPHGPQVFTSDGAKTISTVTVTPRGGRVRLDILTGFTWSTTLAGALGGADGLDTTIAIKRGTTTLKSWTTTSTGGVDGSGNGFGSDANDVHWVMTDTPTVGTGTTYTIVITFPDLGSFPESFHVNDTQLMVTEFRAQ